MPALPAINSQMKERFVLDRKQNILFINFADLRIESRAQVDELERLVREAVETNGRRVYSVVNYEGTEIEPDIIDYYGERIKELQDRYAFSTVRYSSSGLTRSMLRYLGAAKDLESNIFTTRDEAIRAIQELESRTPAPVGLSMWRAINPQRSLLGKLSIGWLCGMALLVLIYLIGVRFFDMAEQQRVLRFIVCAASLALVLSAVINAVFVHFSVIKPLRRMENLARSLVIGGAFEPIETRARDEAGQLARVLNEAARQLRRDIERLSGLYHISLMMGTGTEVSRLCELLTRKIARLLGADMCVILLYDAGTNLIHAQLPAYNISDEHARLLCSSLDETNIASWVFKMGEAYLTNDVSIDPIINRSAAKMLNLRAVLAVPVQAGKQTLGTIEVMNKAGGFLEEDKRLVTIFAAQAAHLLVNAQLFEQVRESEERHRQIFESALDGLYRSTSAGEFVTVNPALASMLGYADATELTGANLIDDLFVEKKVGADLMNDLVARGQLTDVECELRRKSGAHISTRLSVRAVTDRANGEIYHLGIVRDVTEQKRLAEQLLISEQLAVVGELVAGVAHEVRNPLCGITATLSALARRLEDKEAAQPFINVVMSEVAHLNHLMEQLLEHSRPARPDKNPADIRALINEVASELSAQIETKRVHFICEYSEAMPKFRFDRRKMHGVFMNLLDNSLQHTDDDGSIKITVTTTRNGGYHNAIKIEISDTGCGIAPENLTRIFEPFFTTRTTGTGLGLAIARKAVHDHGGSITAHSAIDQGTTFVIHLPLSA